MPPPPRYTSHYHPVTGSWYVYDRLLSVSMCAATSALSAADLAHAEENGWRARCQRWVEAEHRAPTP